MPFLAAFAVSCLCLGATQLRAQKLAPTSFENSLADNSASNSASRPTLPADTHPADTRLADFDTLEAAFRGQPHPLPFAAGDSSSQETSLPDASLPDAPLPDAILTAGDKQTPAQDDQAAQARQQKQHKHYCKWRYCPDKQIDWYMRFENGPQVRRMTPKEKAWLAARNVIDPFNIITILGISAISVAADSHSAYGPGFPGWGRYVGVSFTEDITSQFFGTFLISSLAHQDPHYHRLPDASIKKRIAHATYQIVWTQGDDGQGMFNYATVIGAGIDDLIANTYVPGRDTSPGATAERYGIALATAPISNYITEFLPDVASRIHVQVVIVQRIIDQFATNRTNNGT